MLGLQNMIIIDAELQLDRHKLIYFFAAEQRVDYRQLITELYSIYKTRIWFEQVSQL